MPVVTLITADRLQECLQGDRRLRLYIILAIETQYLLETSNCG